MLAEYSNKFIIPFAAKLESCHIKSKATALDSKNKTVTLENGQTIKYTELVIATGTSAPFPGKLGLDNPSMTKEEILQKYAEIRKEVRFSKLARWSSGNAFVSRARGLWFKSRTGQFEHSFAYC